MSRLSCGVLFAANLLADTANGEPAPEQLAREFASCAAYYFSATNVRPMSDYEALYAAGEQAANRIRKIVNRRAAERLIGDAALSISELTGGDWRNFQRVETRYAARCDGLMGITP